MAIQYADLDPHLKLDIYKRAEDRVIDNVVNDFAEAGIVTARTIVRLTIWELRPCGWIPFETPGDRVEAREYNLRPDEIHDIWERYKEFHNYCVGCDEDPRKIRWDPVGWEGLVDVLVIAAKQLNEVQNRYFLRQPQQDD